MFTCESACAAPYGYEHWSWFADRAAASPTMTQPRLQPRSIKRLMFMETSRRRSPSTIMSPTLVRRASISCSVSSPILFPRRPVVGAEAPGLAATYTKDVCQRDNSVLVIWYVDAGNTSHSTFSNHLSSLRKFTPRPLILNFVVGAQKAQHSSDIVTKNQPTFAAG